MKYERRVNSIFIQELYNNTMKDDKREKLKRIYGFLAKITEVNTKRAQRNMAQYAIDSSKMIDDLNRHSIRKDIDGIQTTKREIAEEVNEQFQQQKIESEHPRVDDGEILALFPYGDGHSPPMALSNGLDFEFGIDGAGNFILNREISETDINQIIGNFRYFIDRGYKIYKITQEGRNLKSQPKYTENPHLLRRQIFGERVHAKTKSNFIVNILQQRIVAVKSKPRKRK